MDKNGRTAIKRDNARRNSCVTNSSRYLADMTTTIRGRTIPWEVRIINIATSDNPQIVDSWDLDYRDIKELP